MKNQTTLVLTSLALAGTALVGVPALSYFCAASNMANVPAVIGLWTVAGLIQVGLIAIIGASALRLLTAKRAAVVADRPARALTQEERDQIVAQTATPEPIETTIEHEQAA